MKILITGANGYIGSKVADKLFKNNYDVIATDIASNNINPKIKFVPSNIFKLDKSIKEKFDSPDICIHLAWRNGFNHNEKTHILDLSNHFHFLDKCIDEGLNKIVVMGSMHEIGYWEGEVNNETPTNPAFYIYSNDENSPNVFGKILKAAKSGEKLFPINSGKNMYDFIEIDELTHQICVASLQDRYLGIINCCSGNAIKLSDKLNEFIEDNDLSISLDYNRFPERAYDSPIIYGSSDIIKDICKEFKL
jgi:dTDP-6-deoxy-L-talose 4-dehydrogenase (NAD+)